MKYVTKQEFDDLEKRVADLERVKSSSKNAERREMTVREFILDRKPKSGAEKALCLIYFREENEGVTGGITSKDLSSAFKTAREKIPRNVSDVLSQCSKKGWIACDSENGKKKSWKLTSTGI